MFHLVTIIMVGYLLFEKAAGLLVPIIESQVFKSSPIFWTQSEVQSSSEIKPSPCLLCFAVEPLNSLPLQSKRWFSHQMRRLKARRDSWGTTGRQNTTGSLWRAHKWPKSQTKKKKSQLRINGFHKKLLHDRRCLSDNRKQRQLLDTSPVFGFQQRILLSFALLSRSSESAWLQDIDRIPLNERVNRIHIIKSEKLKTIKRCQNCPHLVWFSRTLRGDVAKRRSHIWMTGNLSSSEAKTNWVATSGCQSIPEQCIYNK